MTEDFDNQKITWVGAFENLVHITGGPPPVIKDVCPVAHQTPILDKVSRWVDSRQPILSCQVYDPCPVSTRKWFEITIRASAPPLFAVLNALSKSSGPLTSTD